ncbi:hypothetical protein [Microbaculum marinisediminis]|uniref:Cysteine rich repeat-containing protein n=1 Tax=Microbaculum marinisediminis TaxID=2931392 RepID=A0AAW5R6F4_9HYPH|nr:hypothetical protein [Microbaculum sp. A6E488]MCT8974667.1 hypothetical protein [Microbaculum sp. A6E488]
MDERRGVAAQTETDLRLRLSVVAASLLTALFITMPGTAQADDMMSSCEGEIAAVCSGVSMGRGRIAACLYANGDNLSGACKIEVLKVSNSRTFQRYLPTGIHSLQGLDQESDLRAACIADADKVCTGVTKDKGRLLACVYSRSNRVSEACWAAAKQSSID